MEARLDEITARVDSFVGWNKDRCGGMRVFSIAIERELKDCISLLDDNRAKLDQVTHCDYPEAFQLLHLLEEERKTIAARIDMSVTLLRILQQTQENQVVGFRAFKAATDQEVDALAVEFPGVSQDPKWRRIKAFVSRK